jgi:hypothetical protein
MTKYTPKATRKLQTLLTLLQTHPHLLDSIKQELETLSKETIISLVQKDSHKKSVRRLWFFYEFFFETIPELPDLTHGTYFLLLHPSKCYTSAPEKSLRHRLLVNLLGNKDFCPTVKRTPLLKKLSSSYLEKEARKQGCPTPSAHPFTLPPCDRAEHEKLKKRLLCLKKAIHFANTKPSLTVDLLFKAHATVCGKEHKETTFRTHQNYLAYGEKTTRKSICRISPKPEDIVSLLSGLLVSYHKMKKAKIPPVILASVISFGFSIIHPFGDGNGRVQLFLLYLLLHTRGFEETAEIFAKNIACFFYHPQFHQAISEFDKKLLASLSFVLHKDETISVQGNQSTLYRTIDFTPMCEFCAEFLHEAIHLK